jgi:hypothetical protein
LFLFTISVVYAHTVAYGQNNVSGGTSYLKGDVYTAGSCTNTYEFFPGGYNPLDAKKYPLIIYLPGASQMIQSPDKALELAKLDDDGLPKKIEDNLFPNSYTINGTTYQFIVIAIQCCCFGAGPTDVENFINGYILPTYGNKIDLARIYMTGISKGGGRAWEFMNLARRANMIAAVAPIAGGTDYPIETDQTNFNSVVTNILGNTSMGVYPAHNDLDGSVPSFNTKQFVNALNSLSINRASMNIWEGTTNHDSWTRAYNSSLLEFGGRNIFEWMLLHSIGQLAPLPVTLTSFDAIAKGSVVELNWNTESESNSSHFAVERSSNGREFKEIGRVKSSGNSTTAKNYKFTDNNPLSGNNYYRLKMVDLDATFKYSEVRRVSMNGSDLEFSFGPNPVINEANIRITGNQRTRLNITVTDLMGRTLKSMSVSKSDIVFSQKISLAELPAGQYVLSIKGDNVNYTQRIMKR